MRGSRGVTLIMVAGVLAILAATGAGFYVIVASQTSSAVRHSDAIRTELLAAAGLADAVARLRELAAEKTEDPADAWYGVDYRKGARRRISFAQRNSVPSLPEKSYSRSPASSLEPGSDRFILNIADTSGKININACDNLAVVLDNLCRVIGAPLVAADLDSIQPVRWSQEGAAGYGGNSDDKGANKDIYYEVDRDGNPVKRKANGAALYGDGYAIAAYRSRLPEGRFKSIEDVKRAVSVFPRPNHPELEALERDLKFAALQEYITVDSWVDTTTVCTGKFEWTTQDTAIDRDKSWVADDPKNDPHNHRGSLRGSYVSIVQGHGAGQLRKIKTNGIDWIQVEKPFVIQPGPVSSYIIVPRMDATPDPMEPENNVSPQLLDLKPIGTLEDDPDIDYQRWPLCIHRAPVNINTASDKVLAALFLNINVQHGHPMAVGTQSDRKRFRDAWYKSDFVSLHPDGHDQEHSVLTLTGAKRVPQDTGKPVLNGRLKDTVKAPAVLEDFHYINNFETLSSSGDFVPEGGDINEAHELAYRIIQARQRTIDPRTGQAIEPTKKDPDPITADADSGFPGYERGPIKSWDDLFFRIVRPWDDIRSYGDPKDTARKTIPYSGNPGVTMSKERVSVARLIMAHFNSNTDILKFNPNIEWIDRWGRNFTQVEPIMVYKAELPLWLPGDPTHMWPYQSSTTPISDTIYKGAYYIRGFRYKSDEMLDKTDLNRSTTEFCFHSNGVYEIVSTGQVVKNGETLAERKLRAVVKIYDVWRETTQAQFTRGVFEAPPGMGALGTSQSGSVTRDSLNTDRRLPLTTLPEPLVPSGYTLNAGEKNEDMVDRDSKGGHDAFGKVKEPGIPDAVANRILPAMYDGQIVLATNTLDYASDNGTFLASFNGDLDSDACKGNGREQAKVPTNRRVRVVDTVGLLGVLNDKQIDFDPVENDPGALKSLSAAAFNLFTTTSAGNDAFKRLDETKYWQHSTVRQGDLRPDGAWLGNIGVSGKDATLKYPMKDNYNPDGNDGATVFMWFKPAWHTTDHREHEFFNASRPPVNGGGIRQHTLTKYGRFSCAKPSDVGGDGSQGNRSSDCCLNFVIWGFDTNAVGNRDWNAYLHGGFWRVPYTPGRSFIRESPSFHVQPFRWGSIGGIVRPHTTVSGNSGNEWAGWWETSTTAAIAARDDFIKNAERPFIDSQRDPEGPHWSAQYFWKDAAAPTLPISDITTPGTSQNTVPQAAAWNWCDGAATEPVFSINNMNPARSQWLGRSTPADGTCAVIDELKLCNKIWTSQRIFEEQTKCRYYTPSNPELKQQCPVFISQSLQQSLKGDGKKGEGEWVTPISVTWSGFNPRFLHDNKELRGTRTEIYKGVAKSTGKFRGPFYYIQYNLDVLSFVAFAEGQPNEGSRNQPTMLNKVSVSPFGVERPSPADYKAFAQSTVGGQPHYSSGFEVELLDSAAPSGTAGALSSMTFVDPDEHNKIGDPKKPQRVKSGRLRYRVRFRYRLDDLLSSVYNESGKHVNPSRHFTLDTPVFDDISIKYFPERVVVKFREMINE